MTVIDIKMYNVNEVAKHTRIHMISKTKSGCRDDNQEEEEAAPQK